MPMKIIKVGLSLVITLSLIYSLNREWNVGTPIPPLGKFLDPFHGFWHNAEIGSPPNQLIDAEGLQEQVTVVYDSLLIPHIFAENENDLFFTQGYITAQNRLWQMEFQTLSAAGRISEIIGPDALDYDRTQRRQGLVFGAENSLRAMENDPTAKMMIESYSAGINQYIHQLTYEDMSIEYKLLNYEPEEWTPLKVGLLLMNMAKTLNIGEKDFEMTNALRLFGKETLDILYPDNERVGDPIVDMPGNWDFDPIEVSDSIPLALPDELITLAPFDKPDIGIGSNNWALDGSKTASGYPMLSNDPHLNLSLPSLWYVIHLNAPGLNVMGASLPGAPAVISGFNDSIAWGVTNGQRDVVDWYKIQFRDNSNSEYLSDYSWVPSRKVIEEIKIKDGITFYDTVTYTHHGPVVFDDRFHGEDEKNSYAFRWIAHDPSLEILTFYKLNHAQNFDEYMEALDLFSSPGQNFAFASSGGDIAIRVQGKYPVRRQQEGKFVLDGTKTATEWKAFIPNEQNIIQKNPSRGFVSSANQYPVDETYPYYITAENYDAYRNRRINNLLSRMATAVPEDLMKLQFDMFNLMASESLPFWLSYLNLEELNATELNAFQKIKSWNFYNTIQSEEASYYEAWWNALYPLVWDEMRGPLALTFPSTYTTLQLIREQPEFSFFDIQSTPEVETAQEVVQKAFRLGVQTIEEWKLEHDGKLPTWGIYKDTYIGHLLRQEAFSYHVLHGGNRNIVNASSRTWGPSWRMIVSLEPSGTQAWGIYPGGQSGNPGSPYYSNLIEPWTRGEYFKLEFGASMAAVQEKGLATLTLNPY